MPRPPCPPHPPHARAPPPKPPPGPPRPRGLAILSPIIQPGVGLVVVGSVARVTTLSILLLGWSWLLSLVWKTWWPTPSPGPLQVLPSCHRWLACEPRHLQPSSLFTQQEWPSSHRRLACVPSHLGISSFFTQQERPAATCSCHRLLLQSVGCQQTCSSALSPLFHLPEPSSPPVWTSQRCLLLQGHAKGCCTSRPGIPRGQQSYLPRVGVAV